MHLILLHSGTFHSGTKASWYSRLISFCMLTILPLQLLSLLCCSNSQTVKAKWYLFCSFEYEALMSLHHVSVFSDYVQHFLILVTQLVRQCRNFSLPSLWEIVALEETFLMPYCKLWPDYFSYISTSWGLYCQVERYLHKYSCYFSAQSVIYKFSRLLNSPV